MPFVRLLIPLVLGILSAVFFGVDLGLFVIAVIFGFLGMVFLLNVKDFRISFRLKYFQAPLVFLMIYGVGGMLTLESITVKEDNHFSQFPEGKWLIGELKESLTEKEKSYRTVMEVHEVKTMGKWRSAKGNVLIYLAKDSSSSALELGDVIIFPQGAKEVLPPSNPGEFNYKRFLTFRDIYHQQYLRTNAWKRVDKRPSLYTYAERIRGYLIGRLSEEGLGDDEVAIASALLLGKKDQLSSELIHAYAGAGAMHVLAVSGLHMGILFYLLSKLFSPLKKRPKGHIVEIILILIIMWAFAFITGLSPSVVRASTMFSAVAISRLFKRSSNVYNTIAASAFVLLIFRPFYIMEVGFQLSYLAVLGIIYLQPKIKSLLYFRSTLANKAWEITAVSVAAQIATFPLGLLYFHQFPSYFLFSNLLVIPAAFVVLVLGFGYFLFFAVPFIGEGIAFLLKWLIRGLNTSVKFIQELPSALISGVDIGILETWLIYALIIALSLAFIRRNKKLLISSLSLGLLILLFQFWESYSFQRHTYLTVYDVKKTSVVNLLSKHDNVVLTDSVMVEDQNKQQFHLRNNWNRHSAPEPRFNCLDEIIPGLYQYQGKTLCLLDSWQDIPKVKEPIEVNYLVISYFKGMKMKPILEAYSAEMIIIDSTVREKKAARLLSSLHPDQEVHAVVFDGFFQALLH